VLIEVWRELARRFGEIKFCQIQGDLCIEGYPDRNCPTVLVYKDGDVKKQIVTLKELNGERTKTDGECGTSGEGRLRVRSIYGYADLFDCRC
jgi:hypothetical protein